MAAIQVTGTNVSLRILCGKDITEEFNSWVHDKEINKYLEVRHNLPTLEEQRLLVDTYDSVNRFFFGIYCNKTNKPIGTITLMKDKFYDTATYGYLIGDKSYWGTTAGFDACALLLDFAFLDLGLRRVSGGVYADNLSSMFNLKKLGFKKEGQFRKALILDNAPCDSFYFGILKDEWLERRNKLNY